MAQSGVGWVDVGIDWVSFTLETENEPVAASELYHIARALLRKVSVSHEQYIFDGQGFEQDQSRPPYRICLARDDHGLRIYGGSHTGTVLFELSGRGCGGLRETEFAFAFIGGVADRISRLDIAADIRCDVQPAEFVNDRFHQAFRSIGFVRSDTGETAYVGSPKSDRFCRVYRYREPHPRSALLRSEFVFRRGLAKDAAAKLLGEADLAAFVAKLGNTWGFAHPIWKPEIKTDEKLRVPVVSKKSQDTLSWLYYQVAPAMRRLMDEGSLDMTDFLGYVYGQNEPGEHALNNHD